MQQTLIMEDQTATVSMTTFPNVAPSEIFSPASLCSRRPAVAAQNLGTPEEHFQNPGPSTSSRPMFHFQKQNSALLTSYIPMVHFQKQNPGPSTNSIPIPNFQHQYAGLSTSSTSIVNFQKQNPDPFNSSIPMANFEKQNPGTSTSSTPIVNFQKQNPGTSTSSTLIVNLQKQDPDLLTSCTTVVHFQKKLQHCEVGQTSKSTMVRLVSPEGDSRAETILHNDALVDEVEMPSTSPDDVERNVTMKNQLKDSKTRVPSPKTEYTWRQWFLLGLAWLIAVNGLILYVFLLVLTLSGYSHLLLSRVRSIFITVNGIISFSAAVYFFVRIRKYLR